MTNERLNKIAEKVEWPADDGYVNKETIPELLVEVYRLRSEIADARARELEARIVHLEAELAKAQALAAMNADASRAHMQRAEKAELALSGISDGPVKALACRWCGALT